MVVFSEEVEEAIDREEVVGVAAVDGGADAEAVAHVGRRLLEGFRVGQMIILLLL